MTIFNIFKRDAQNRGYRYRKGYKPRVSSHGLFGLNKKLDDPISWRANNMSEAYGLKSAELQGKALEERDAAMAKWQDASLRDAREQYVENGLKQMASLRQEGSEALDNVQQVGRGPSSTAEAANVYQQRVAGFRRAQQKLRAADDASDIGGSNVKFNLTGYEYLDPSADVFYERFDNEIAERRDMYAQMYGGTAYDDLNYGYAWMQGEESANQEDVEAWAASQGLDMQYFTDTRSLRDRQRDKITGNESPFDSWSEEQRVTASQILYGSAGRSDIDAQILGDILNTNDYDIAFLDSSDAYDDGGFTADTLESVRASMGALYTQSREAQNELGALEDENRAALAAKMRAEAVKSQKRISDKSKESIALQIGDIKEAERAAKMKFDEQTASLTDGLASSKKKVKGVAFDADRPQ